MNIMAIGLVILFWLLYVVAQGAFKWGSSDVHRQLWGFIIGNIFGLTSTWVLMVMYRHMNSSVAFGVGLGGGFFITQLVLAVVFKTAISPFQWAGIASIVVGIILLAKG